MFPILTIDLASWSKNRLSSSTYLLTNCIVVPGLPVKSTSSEVRSPFPHGMSLKYVLSNFSGEAKAKGEMLLSPPDLGQTDFKL